MHPATDRYTKFILTVIAACLVALVLEGAPIRPASAADAPKSDAPQRVEVVGAVEVKPSTKPTDVILLGYRKAFPYDSPLGVSIER